MLTKNITLRDNYYKEENISTLYCVMMIGCSPRDVLSLLICLKYYSLLIRLWKERLLSVCISNDLTWKQYLKKTNQAKQQKEFPHVGPHGSWDINHTTPSP